jgi:hypothetical protein
MVTVSASFDIWNDYKKERLATTKNSLTQRDDVRARFSALGGLEQHSTLYIYNHAENKAVPYCRMVKYCATAGSENAT